MPTETSDTQVQGPNNNTAPAFDIKALYDNFDATKKEISNGSLSGNASGELDTLEVVAPPPAPVPRAEVDTDGSIVFDGDYRDQSNFDNRNAEKSKQKLEQSQQKLKSDVGPNGKVIKDDQGRVVEVDYPNGTSRKFGYGEDGKLNRIEQPDGSVLELKDGKWQYAKPEASVIPKPHKPGQKPSDSPQRGQIESTNGPAEVTTDNPAGDGIKWPHGSGIKLGGPDIINPQVNEDGTLTYQTSDGGEYSFFSNGNSQIHSSKDGSLVSRDGEGRVVSVVTGRAEVSAFGYDDDGNLNYFNDNGHSYYFKGGKWTTAEGQPAPVADVQVNEKGVITYSKPETAETIEKRPDRSYVITSSNGAKNEYNGDGQVIRYRGADGKVQRGYEYDANGELNKVTEKNGDTLTRDERGNWTDQEGRKVSNLQLDKDGRLQYTDGDGHIVVENTDGSKTTTALTEEQLQEIMRTIHDGGEIPDWLPGAAGEKINDALTNLSPADRVALQQMYEQEYDSRLTDDLVEKFGWDQVGQAVAGLEAARLMDDAARNLPAAERQEFLNNLNTFLQRAEQADISPEAVARTLAATDKLLTASDGKVDANLRQVLAQQMMAFAATPASIDQGRHLTCNVTDVEVVTWMKNPAAAAEMVSSMALTGEWTAPDGHKVTIPPQNFVPQEGSYDSTSSDERLFASQIFQSTAIADWGSRQHPPMYYTQLQPDAQNSTGEFWTDENGIPLPDKDKDGNPIPKAFRGWGCEAIAEEVQRLNPDQSAFFINGKYGDLDGKGTTFDNEQEFREELAKAEAEGRMPIIIYVAAGDPVFGGNAEPGSAGHKMNHVVVIDDYNPVTGQVFINNSWGDRSDHWVSVGDMYRATYN